MKKVSFGKIFAMVFPFLLSAIVIAAVWYLLLPAITLRNSGFILTLSFSLFILATNVSTANLITECFDDYAWLRFGLWILAGVVLVVFLVMLLSSWMWFHTDKAIEVADVTVSDNSVSEVFPDLAVAGTKDLPLVDLDTAIMLGDKKVAGLKDAPWYEVDKQYSLVKYQGKYYRLAFLNYGGFLKYNKAKYDGIPGYILVETTPDGESISQDARLVKLQQPIRYSESAFWSYDLKRHLRSQYSNYIFANSSICEIDEDGVPYYVTGVMRPTAGAFGVKIMNSFILTNACTGESIEYSVNEAPEWIDNVYTLEYLMRVAEWRYTYRNGYWNFSNTNVWHTSYHYRDQRKSSDDGEFANFYGYAATVADGQVHYYTGLTAANAAESNLGWLLMNMRTGEMTEFAVVGAEESSAQAAVEQLVSAYRYQATFPLPANIGGEESYIMCLKGSAGIVQAYAICNVENYSLAVQAETLPEAINLYLAKLGYTADRTSIETDSIEPVVAYEVPFTEGEVVNTYTVEVNGTEQHYYEIADGSLYVVVKIK